MRDRRRNKKVYQEDEINIEDKGPEMEPISDDDIIVEEDKDELDDDTPGFENDEDQLIREDEL